MPRLFDGTRRNRNFGTSKRGYSRNNEFRIPAICRNENQWWERLGNHERHERSIGESQLSFFIESTRPQHLHCCSIEDVCHLLANIDVRVWRGVGAIIFRQSTRKQWIAAPTWGRVAFSASIVSGNNELYSGCAIFLEAIDPNETWEWGKNLSKSDAEELDNLRNEGHSVRTDKRSFKIQSSVLAVRNTQLYRTLLHELGHWHDWQGRELDGYWARPVEERERYAARFAEKLKSSLSKAGAIPFAAK